MSKFRARRCYECGAGKIGMLARAGRKTAHRNLAHLSVPADLAIPTCDRCGTEWFDAESARRVDAALDQVCRAELRRRVRRAIETISRHVPQQKVEKLLGLSQGYLSKLKSGDRVPSPEMVSDLALIARAPRRRVRELEEFWGHDEAA